MRANRAERYARRLVRMHPQRDKVTLYNRNGEELTYIEDAPWDDVSINDAAIVVNLHNESRTWILSKEQCGEYTPVPGYRIRSRTTDTLWEIISIQRQTFSIFECVCTKMNENDSEVP